MLSSQNIHDYFNKYNELFDTFYGKLHDKFSQDVNLLQDFIEVVGMCLKMLNDNKIDLHSHERTELVTDLINKLITELNISDTDKDLLNNYVYYMLPDIVELLIATSKGYMYLKQVETKIKNGGCFGFFKPKEKQRDAATDAAIVTVDNVYAQLKSMIKNKTVDISNLMSIVTITMQLVEQISGLTGAQKKDMVMQLMNRLIDDVPMDDTNKAALRAILTTTVNAAIDFVVSVANGEINLVQLVKDNVDWCKKSCGCAKATK